MEKISKEHQAYIEKTQEEKNNQERKRKLDESIKKPQDKGVNQRKLQQTTIHKETLLFQNNLQLIYWVERRKIVEIRK